MQTIFGTRGSSILLRKTLNLSCKVRLFSYRLLQDAPPDYNTFIGEELLRTPNLKSDNKQVVQIIQSHRTRLNKRVIKQTYSEERSDYEKLLRFCRKNSVLITKDAENSAKWSLDCGNIISFVGIIGSFGLFIGAVILMGEEGPIIVGMTLISLVLCA